jgi:hypothetical protein
MYFGISWAQNVPYPTIPDWESNAGGQYSTGLGIADINGDGWKDLVVANGNDMARKNLVVYYNEGDGTFDVIPGWISSDVDYHGHLACGDLDSDGDIDVAVSVYIGPSGFSAPGKLKIYYNQGGTLESTPSFVSNSFYTFSCAMGDADGDGDLDIAAVAGEPYSGLLDYGRIFLNNQGQFNPEAEWKSAIMMGALDVEFGDINRDGFLDLVYACEGTPNMIYLAGEDGVIDTEPDWQSAEPVNYINSVEIGYELDQTVVAMTENDQLGGEGRVRRYNFSSALPSTSQADWYSDPFGYGSGIAMTDFDQGNLLDVIYGGWWLPVKIAYGDGSGFENTSSYTSSTGSVVEAIVLADLGREDEWFTPESFIVEAEQAGSNVIILSADLVDRVVNIFINSVLLEPAHYSHIPGKPWISFREPLAAGDLVGINYIYSPYPDMVITNWDSNKGNYIFYNTDGGLQLEESDPSDSGLEVAPNPSSGFFELRFPNHPKLLEIIIMDATGRVIHREISSAPGRIVSINASGWPHGLYFLECLSHGNKWMEKLVKVP